MCIPKPSSGLFESAVGGKVSVVGDLFVVGWKTLCLPLIRPTGSRRTPAVFVVESTHAWHLHHPALARRMRTPRLGRIFGQR